MADIAKQVSASKPGQYIEMSNSSKSGEGISEIDEEVLGEITDSEGKQLPLQELSLMSAMLKLIDHKSQLSKLISRGKLPDIAQKENIPDSTSSDHSNYSSSTSSSHPRPQHSTALEVPSQPGENSSKEQITQQEANQSQQTARAILIHILSKYFDSNQQNEETAQEPVLDLVSEQQNDKRNGTCLLCDVKLCFNDFMMFDIVTIVSM